MENFCIRCIFASNLQTILNIPLYGRRFGIYSKCNPFSPFIYLNSYFANRYILVYNERRDIRQHLVIITVLTINSLGNNPFSGCIVDLQCPVRSISSGGVSVLHENPPSNVATFCQNHSETRIPRMEFMPTALINQNNK